MATSRLGVGFCCALLALQELECEFVVEVRFISVCVLLFFFLLWKHPRGANWRLGAPSCKELQTQSEKTQKERLKVLVFTTETTVRQTYRTCHHITPTLRSLHWLPVSFRIDFNILLLTFNGL